MKNNWLIAFLLLFKLSGLAQKNKIEPIPSQSFLQWGNLQKGKYAVGYKDTLIIKNDEYFTYLDSNAPKPIFLSVWYPGKDDQTKNYMKFGEYIRVENNERYKVLSDSLISIFKYILIKDGICIDIKNYTDVAPNDTLQKLYNNILETTVCAKENLEPIIGKFPCILYHHGAQSSPFDNNAFCEYIASKGYIVISANYNLPNDKKSRSLRTSTNKDFNNLTDMQFVLCQIMKMKNIDTTNITAIGHSYGAQTLIRFDNQSKEKKLRKIISLHTTLEDKSLEIAKKFWPEFEFLYNNDAKNCTTPVVFFAPMQLVNLLDVDTLTGKETDLGIDTLEPKFIPFKNNKTTPYVFLTLKHNVKHDGFISLGNLRFAYARKYKLLDCEEIVAQQKFYELEIELIEKLMQSNSANSIITQEIINEKLINVELFNVEK